LIHCGRQLVVTRLRTLSRSEGGALVEMALSLPIVLLLMTGIFTFSMATNQKLELTEAVTNGGRTLAVDRGDTDPCKTVANAIYAAAPGLSSTNITLTFVLGSTTTNGATCAGTGGAANANLVSGGNAEIIASYPCSLIVYGKNFGACTLSSQITEIVQ
jgi:Flp pilus assembly protein TadG